MPDSLKLPAHRPRASNRVWAELRPRTRNAYSSLTDGYKQFALERGFDARLPEVEVIRELLAKRRIERGCMSARKLSNALAHYFANEGVPVIVDHPRIQAVLDYPDRTYPWDPDDGPEAIRRRAAWYAGNAYAETTRTRYERMGREWETYADDHAFDPTNPGIGRLANYLASFAEKKAASTVHNRANGLSYYFRQQGIEDFIRHPAIQAMLEGIRRRKPPKPFAAVEIEQARLVMQSFDLTCALDVRDALMMAVMINSGLAARHLRAFDRSRTRSSPAGVTFFADYSRKRVFFVPNGPYPELNVTRLLAKWLLYVGTEPGPVFARLLPRGNFGNVLNDVVISSIVSRRLKASGLSGRVNCTSLRKAFVQRSATASRSVEAASVGGYKSPENMAHYVPDVARELELLYPKRFRGSRRMRRSHRSV